MESVCIDPRRAAEQGWGPGPRRIFLTALLVLLPFPAWEFELGRFWTVRIPRVQMRRILARSILTFGASWS